ncbi:ATP-binding protein [Desmonostoc muscorum LEGE 12446]|uniref:ATP-binding protein n=1 Tax=Desmonostoc muscorum LEGE 12446 TaxID=1828758 RepID=A0A8J7AGJ4_DESMC|nr:AAA family ATPase [Desmonostoc muscorum]MCF2151072.1 ATP-binding protein [Desmonostoc muscorum LEGE 12446]
MPNNIFQNAYTDAPQQHPNLILGSLQLLFWLFFRPTAWRNHLKGIDPNLNSDISLIFFILICFILRGEWRNLRLCQLFIQVYLILPILTNLLLGLVLWVLGEPIATIADRVVRGVQGNVVLSVFFGVFLGVLLNVAFCMMFALVFGMVFSLTGGVAFSLAGGVPGEVAAGVVLGMAFGMAGGVAGGVRQSMTFGVAFSAAFVGVVFGIGGGVAFGVLAGVAFGVGVTINSWLSVLSFPFLTSWNYLLYRLDKRRNAKSPCLLRFHSAFWDEWQRLHLPGLDKHLLFVITHNPVEGKAALEYLSTSRQRWAAQAVQIELDARSLQDCADVETIREAHHILLIDEIENELSSTRILKIFSRISEDVDAALNQASYYNQRLVLRAFVDKLNLELENFARRSDKYTVRFYPILKSWGEIATNHIDELAKITEQRQEIDSPYIIGVPLTEEQKIFTGRNDIGARIEQLLLDRRRPPLLLYGQRRMGKTSLLNNIGKLLPNTIIPMFIDLQGAPSSASDHAGFLYNLAREMEKSAKKQGLTLPSLAREVLKSDPFTYFYEWLDKVEQALERNTALLALDEFEVLDNAIAKGRFDEQDVLGMLRHLIQHRPRFKVLLAGSHTIEEYQRWASYLINVQVVHISYLKEAEARQLIERPVKDFTLRYEPNAVERVLQLTRCHPFLVQLLCAEIIVLKNEQDPSIRRFATLADVEAAIPEALQSGGFFFADIQNNQVDATGQAILRFIAAQGEGAIVRRESLLQRSPDAEITLKLLLQRELIEEVEDGYCFQVELIRRWFV